MPSTYSPAAPSASDYLVSDGGEQNPNPGDESGPALDRLRAALTDWLARPADSDLWRQFLAAKRTAAEVVARLPRKETESLAVFDARQLALEAAKSGAHYRPVEADDLTRAAVLARKGWPGVLAAMLLTPAWQWPSAPLLLEVPQWLLADYVRWLFAAPQNFCAPGQAETHAAHALHRLEELVRWVKRAPGAAAETEVLTAFVTEASAIPLYFSTGDLRRHAELRGWLLQRALRLPGDQFEGRASPREGRRLRVGFVHRHFGPDAETFTALPTFAHLDPERFDVILFACTADGNAVEDHCRQHAADFFPLPSDIEGQLAILRAAGLDLAIFGTDLTADCHELTRLALHRVAPLQAATSASCVTTGLPEIDLYISGALAETENAAANYTERLGLLPGPAQSFSFEVNRQEPQLTWTRTGLGLPEDAVLFVSAAHPRKITPEVQHVWAQLLASVPGSHLLLRTFTPKWPVQLPPEHFQAQFEQVLADHGVAASRLALSNESLSSRADVKALLELGDVYLDPFPFGGASSLVDPLELGLPTVACDGRVRRSRQAGALLRSLELPELIAGDPESYHAIALKLALDPTHRADVRKRLQEKMERLPLFLDTLAASEAMGDLLEAACDERLTAGHEAFRSNPAPLRAAPSPAVGAAESPADPEARARLTLRTSPADPEARQARGVALLAAGHTDRAVAYLLAAIQHAEGQPDLWLDLARALKAGGRTSEAIQALEASLRLDESQLEGWLMLAEFAQTVGIMDLAREAAEIAQKLAPADPRPAAFLQS